LKTGWERKPRDKEGKLVQHARSDIKEESKPAKIKTITVEKTNPTPTSDDSSTKAAS